MGIGRLECERPAASSQSKKQESPICLSDNIDLRQMQYSGCKSALLTEFDKPTPQDSMEVQNMAVVREITGINSPNCLYQGAHLGFVTRAN